MQPELKQLALDAGFHRHQGGIRDNGDSDDYWDCWPEQLERFAMLVAQAENERCAKHLESISCEAVPIMQHLAEGLRSSFKRRKSVEPCTPRADYAGPDVNVFARQKEY